MNQQVRSPSLLSVSVSLPCCLSQWTISNAGKDVQKLRPSYFARRRKDHQIIQPFEEILAGFYKAKHVVTIYSSNSTPVFPKEIRRGKKTVVHTNTCM